mgnify:CR=1 FL=1
MKELVFENPPKEMHFEIDDWNVVTWETLPAGESGHTIPFHSGQRAEEFVTSYAIRMGFKIKVTEEGQEPAHFNG